MAAVNLWETSSIMTPLAGAFGGGMAVKSAGSLSTVGGIVTGVLIGIGLLAGFRWLMRAVPERSTIMQKRYEWLAVLTLFFIVPFGFPVLGFVLSRLVVGGLFQL